MADESMMDALARWMRSLSRAGEVAWQSIETDLDGFTMGDRRIDWRSVDSITAFKRDAITVDDVWFELVIGADSVFVCEEQPGFPAWEAAICQAFPAVDSWRQLVISPAFAENRTVLYRRGI